MAARKRKRFTKKWAKRGRKPPTKRVQKLARLSVAPGLTKREIRELKTRAAADGRSIGSFVAFLISEDLKQPASSRRPLPALPAHKRAPYWIQCSVTPAQAKRIEARMKAERRTFSNYVARVVVSDLSES